MIDNLKHVIHNYRARLTKMLQQFCFSILILHLPIYLLS